MATQNQRRAIIMQKLQKPAAVLRAITIVYENQTSEEQAGQQTTHLNGIGFSQNDAGFGSSLAEQIAQRGTLSRRQIEVGRRMISRYWRQLAAAADAKSPGWDEPREDRLDIAAEAEGDLRYEAEREAMRHIDDREEEDAYGY